MKLLLSVMTCDGREEALARTLESIRASDWGEEPLIVHDETRHPDRQLSIVTTARVILDRVTGFDWDVWVFAEDDVIVNKFLRHNLERWTPLVNDTLLVGTLYHAAEPVPVTMDYGLVHCRQIGGSQAAVISRKWFPTLAERWEKLAHEGMQDLRMYRSVEDVFPWIPVHTPNLVDHQAVASTWGGRPHSSPSFSPDWRA